MPDRHRSLHAAGASRRCGALAADPDQPDGQRRQIHASGRAHPPAGPARRQPPSFRKPEQGAIPVLRARHRRRHRPGSAAAAVPAVQTGRLIADPAARRHGPRPEHRPVYGRKHGRGNLGRIGSRTGKHVRVLHTAGASGTGGSARRQYLHGSAGGRGQLVGYGRPGHAPHAGGPRHPVPEPYRQQGGPAFRPCLAGERTAQA